MTDLSHSREGGNPADNGDAILDYLDLWSSVYTKKAATGRGSNGKITPYGIQKLRELILELAVRGKLVPQDPNDEPASVLLEKISEERARLIREGAIRKQKTLAELADDEKPYVLPATWSWQHFTNVFYPISVSKNKVKASVIQEEGAVPVVDQGQSYVAGYIDNVGLEIELPGPVIVFGDHTSALKYVDFNFVAGADGVKILRPMCCDERYFYLAAKTLPIENRGYGRHYSRLIDNLFPLPPLGEQHRIVAKVDELMALCDQLEQQQTDSLQAHQTLVETLLAALVRPTAMDSGSEENAVEIFFEHFDTLFTTEESIDQLKQTILQLAVMGRLVPQDPNDEPAAVLLEKIAEEKVRLLNEGRIKKPKKLIDFQGLEELKWQLPEHWVYARLADAADIVRGGSPRPAGDPRFYGGSIPFLKVADVTRVSGKLVEGYSATVTEAGLNKTRYIDTRTVLLSNSGATLGIPAICDFPATFNDGIAAFVELSEFVFDEYLYLYLKALSKWFIDIASRGQGQPNLNTDIIKATWFALPPFEEQHRIVAKVDVLMHHCDTLKARIQEAQTTQVHLADTVVEQAVA
jgi:type I restriction enzyme S subunit